MWGGRGTWAAQKHSEAGYGRPVDRGVWTAKTVKRPRQQPAHPQYANYWAPLTCKRHTMPHPTQPQHTNYWAPRTRKRHQQEHRPQRPTESSDPTQHAKGRTGDCPGPRKETTTRRNVTQGVGRGWPGNRTSPPPPGGSLGNCLLQNRGHVVGTKPPAAAAPLPLRRPCHGHTAPPLPRRVSVPRPRPPPSARAPGVRVHPPDGHDRAAGALPGQHVLHRVPLPVVARDVHGAEHDVAERGRGRAAAAAGVLCGEGVVLGRPEDCAAGQHSPNTPTTGLRERGNDTSKSTGCSGRQNAAPRRNMRREEGVTVQGPVKKQPPDGMSHGGQAGGGGGARTPAEGGGGGGRDMGCTVYGRSNTSLGTTAPCRTGLERVFGGGGTEAHLPNPPPNRWSVTIDWVSPL